MNSQSLKHNITTLYISNSLTPSLNYYLSKINAHGVILLHRGNL